jgi:hypothetical protein
MGAEPLSMMLLWRASAPEGSSPDPHDDKQPGPTITATAAELTSHAFSNWGFSNRVSHVSVVETIFRQGKALIGEYRQANINPAACTRKNEVWPIKRCGESRYWGSMSSKNADASQSGKTSYAAAQYINVSCSLQIMEPIAHLSIP